MKTVLALISAAVLCIILTLGLWPFHAPGNDVVWLNNQDGLRFGPYGSAISSGTFPATDSAVSPEISLEIWLRPKRIWDSGTFLSFYEPRNPAQFSLRQSETSVLLESAEPEIRHRVTPAILSVDAFNFFNRPIFLSITSGNQATNIYIDGRLAKTGPGFPLSAENLSGHLILGDSPGQSDSWSGEIRGVAVYRRMLPATRVLDHFATWVKNGRPGISGEDRNVALYVFQERRGTVVRDGGPSGMDLYIPKRYQVMGKTVLQPFWTEFEMTRNYWGAAFKNVVGFIPLGYCFYAFLIALLPGKRVTLLTVCLGTAVSFTIEALQAFLPTRDSGTTDLFTNTIGTWAGVALYNVSTPILLRLFAWWPFPPSSPKRPKAAV